MSTYTQDILGDDEIIIYSGKVSLWSMSAVITIGLLLSIFIIGIIMLITVYVKYKTTEISITNKRIIVKYGLISRETIEINVNRIESIQIYQTFLGRMMNYGNVLISGAGNPQIPIRDISNPLAFSRAFMQAHEKR